VQGNPFILEINIGKGRGGWEYAVKSVRKSSLRAKWRYGGGAGVVALKKTRSHSI